MGVYIKGESKPNICEECWFHVRWNRFEDLQCGLNDKKIIAMNTYEYKGQTAIPDWCPLIEVPEPHGRLIDVKDLSCESIFELDEMIKNAPTIIEAKGE